MSHLLTEIHGHVAEFCSRTHRYIMRSRLTTGTRRISLPVVFRNFNFDHVNLTLKKKKIIITIMESIAFRLIDSRPRPFVRFIFKFSNHR